MYNWRCIIAAIDAKSDTIDSIYMDFVQVIKWHINITIPLRNVVKRERDSCSINPRIKLILSK